ncbi:FxsA family protein [Corynebacterium sp. 335C]
MPAYLLIPYVLVEALAFWAVASWIGWGWALLAIVALFFLGMVLTSWQMRSVLVQASRGERPGRALADTGLIIIGSGLLLIPGFVTAVMGLVLMLPPTRGMVRRALGRRIRRWAEKTAEDSFVYMERFGGAGFARFPGAGGGGFGPAGTPGASGSAGTSGGGRTGAGSDSGSGPAGGSGSRAGRSGADSDSGVIDHEEFDAEFFRNIRPEDITGPRDGGSGTGGSGGASGDGDGPVKG